MDPYGYISQIFQSLRQKSRPSLCKFKTGDEVLPDAGRAMTVSLRTLTPTFLATKHTAVFFKKIQLINHNINELKMPKVSLFDLLFKIFLVTLAVSTIGLSAAGISYAQLEYSRDLFIAILVLTIIAFLALIFICFFVEPSSRKYDFNNVKWNSNYVPYSEATEGETKKKEETDGEHKLDAKLHNDSGEEKKDTAEKAGDSWKKNYVPYKEEVEVSPVEHTRVLTKPRELHEDSNKKVNALNGYEKEEK
ncbi:unnamed protein product [Lepeophtheirus salmonis]|uniref:(salmon louse) hypothetical protein n=1 Tax=Lepeophtheirus salmonis TaxID=72036 RepID=A0A7R8HA12_LEPSM|nr:unnamed protein product [Lepeophtheirus salmonis]CAF2949486.1 unnamed protein product [Lepeophtheirus salmonis]